MRGRLELLEMTLGSRGHLVQGIPFADKETDVKNTKLREKKKKRKKMTEGFLENKYNSYGFNLYKKLIFGRKSTKATTRNFPNDDA